MDAGRIDIQVAWCDGAIADVRVASSRPSASVVLLGKPPAGVLALVPALFSICARAQSVAARAAMDEAHGKRFAPDAWRDAAREVALEALREHLWRLLLDWPALLGQLPLRDVFAGWYRRLNTAADAAHAVSTCEALRDWLLAQGVSEEGGIAVSGGGLASQQFALLLGDPTACDSDQALLPTLSAGDWCSVLPARDATAFARMPLLHGVPAEAGALARHADHAALQSLRRQGRGVAARVAARWMDCMVLANAVAADRLEALQLIDACSDTAGRGVARVETARGTLLHRVAVDARAGTISDYLVVAPTEWNFHPHGPLVHALRGRPCAPEQARALAQRFALALDPCVAHAVQMNPEHDGDAGAAA